MSFCPTYHWGSLRASTVWFTHVYTSPKRGWCRVLAELLNGEETKVYWSPLPPVPYTHSLRLLGVSVYIIIYCSMLSKEPSGNTRGHQSVQFPRVQLQGYIYIIYIIYYIYKLYKLYKMLAISYIHTGSRGQKQPV